MSEGDLTATEGAQVMGLVDSDRRTLEVTELEERVAALGGQVENDRRTDLGAESFKLLPRKQFKPWQAKDAQKIS